MLDNQNFEGMTPGQQLVEGTPIYDANGSKIGTVSEHNVQGRYLVMHKGLLFPRDIYVPLSAIAGTSLDGVQLNIAKDELSNQQWDQPPTNTAAGGALADNATTSETRGSRMQTGVRDTSAHTTPTHDGDVAVPVREEELIAGTRQNEAGRVRLHKDVVEEQQTINVPVTHEEVTVERFPVQGNAADLGQDAFQARDIDVPVMGEEVITEKRGRVAEEVHLHKQAVTEQQQVTDTVRKERVNVVPEGDIETQGIDRQGIGNEGLRNQDQFTEEQRPLS